MRALGKKSVYSANTSNKSNVNFVVNYVIFWDDFQNF